MDGYSYFVISQYLDIKGATGNFASAEKVSRSENLMGVFDRWQGLQSVNACATFSEAKRIAEHWNECYRKNGTFAFAS